MAASDVYIPKYQMHRLLKPSKSGSAELTYFTISHLMSESHRDGIPPGDYVRLLINGRTIMSNTPMEYLTNLEFIQNCYGDVFVAGLGMGMVLMEILDKPDVRSVTVVEKNQDVITLIQPQLPQNRKLKIIKADIFSYSTSKKYDYIYFDIWWAIDPESYIFEMPVLTKRFEKNLKASKQEFKRILCWGQNEGDANLKMYREQLTNEQSNI